MNLVDLIFTPQRRALRALVSPDGAWTYGELEAAVHRTAAALREAGLPPRSAGRVPRVALACPNSAEHVVLALAILAAGACLVPVAGELAAPEREAVLRTVAVDALVIADAFPWPERQGGERLSGVCARFTRLAPPESVPAFEEAALAALDPAFIRFSSGTTGRAKGVILSHRSLHERICVANRRLQITEADCVVWILSMAHHFAVSIMLYLLNGATTGIAPSHLGEELLAVGREWGGSVLYGAPFHHALLAAEPSGAAWPTLRLAISTAASLPESTARAFEARYGVPLTQALGMIEAGLPLLNTVSAREKPTSVGRPGEGLEVSLRDPATGGPVAEGEVGELLLRGGGMFDAYLDPWQPREALLTPERFFPTGDLARCDAEGDYHLVGRVKTVINVGGMKCFPEEIEAVLLGHPGVAAVRVVGRVHERFGAVPVAEIVPEGGAPSIPSLVAHCRAALAGYKVPVAFTFHDRLPQTASGKIRR